MISIFDFKKKKKSSKNQQTKKTRKFVTPQRPYAKYDDIKKKKVGMRWRWVGGWSGGGGWLVVVILLDRGWVVGG